MKGSELERNQVSQELDPFKMINQHPPEDSKSEGRVEQYFEEENNVARMSGYDEAILRMNLQLNENKAFVDQSHLQPAPSLKHKAKSEASREDIDQFDPNVEDPDNPAFGEEEVNGGVEMPDSDEEVKQIPIDDEEFEVIENDFIKQLKHKKPTMPQVKVFEELHSIEPNDVEIISVDVDLLDLVNVKYLKVNLSLSTYKIEFKPYNTRESEIKARVDFKAATTEDQYNYMKLEKYKAQYYSIPIHLIYSVKEYADKKNPDCCFIDFATKDYRSLRVRIMPYKHGKKLLEEMYTHIFPGICMSSAYTYKYSYAVQNWLVPEEEEKKETMYESITLSKREQIEPFTRKFNFPINGWDVYNYAQEFARQGISKKDQIFRLVTCWSSKNDYTLCGTYPKSVFIPHRITDGILRKCSTFRSKCRFPALTYYYKVKKTSMWRWSQNLPGLMNSRGPDDERMLYEIGLTGPKQKKVVIIDARSQIAAYANKAKGGGYEQEQYYGNCKLVFGWIENIHAVRDAYKKCFTICESYHQMKDNKKVQAKIEATGWLNLLKNIILYSTEIANRMHFNEQNVVVHCSDGWDRTSQLCALSQMMLDPFYRTVLGFEVLIEKEWLSFGHKFDSRWGHFKDDSVQPDERSPVFVQFLDAVYQLTNQFPTQFQFNSKLLLFLAHHAYTWKFGTFLFDNEKSRFKDSPLKERSTSIWTYVNDNVYDYINPFYIPSKEVLHPNADYMALDFWRDHFLRWSEFSVYQPGKLFISAEEHKEQIVKNIIEENTLLKKKLRQLEEELARNAEPKS